jgi:signal transduction histidine kinase
VTVWLSPDLESGDTEEGQLKSLTTKFKANCAFDQVHVIHMGGGGGWIFSDMAIATSFDDFIVKHYWQRWWFNTGVAMAVLASVGLVVRVVEKRKFQLRLQSAEQERALERERARIAQDLHDELGSSLTRISLLSGLMRADQNDPAQIEEHLKKISQSADETVRKLEEIVWAVRPGSDSVQSLVEYIAHFANELFDGHQTRCRLDLPQDLPALPLPPEVRHNIFLVVKEALTNVLRHSGAREVSVQARAYGLMMELSVQDDGRGFDTGAPPQNLQDGLANMRRRAEAVGGKLTLESTPGKGTTIRLAVYLAARPK